MHVTSPSPDGGDEIKIIGIIAAIIDDHLLTKMKYVEIDLDIQIKMTLDAMGAQANKLVTFRGSLSMQVAVTRLMT